MLLQCKWWSNMACPVELVEARRTRVGNGEVGMVVGIYCEVSEGNPVVESLSKFRWVSKGLLFVFLLLERDIGLSLFLPFVGDSYYANMSCTKSLQGRRRVFPQHLTLMHIDSSPE